MERLHRATLLTLYQLTLLVGIIMMPIAMVSRKIGIRLPIDRAVLGLKDKYEQTV